MSELSRAEFTHYARLTRLVQGRRQADVATAIGVSATALCRYEQGEDQVLGDPTIARLCDALDLERPSWLEVSAAEEVEAAAPTAGESGEDALIPYFCSTPGCLLHRAYMIGGAFGFLPFWVWGGVGEEICCRYCGVLLRSACCACGAPFERDSGVCGSCATPYVPRLPRNEETLREITWNAEIRRELSPSPQPSTRWTPLDRSRLERALSRLTGREEDVGIPGEGEDEAGR